jgi:hypothetical protein
MKFSPISFRLLIDKGSYFRITLSIKDPIYNSYKFGGKVSLNEKLNLILPSCNILDIAKVVNFS